MKLFRKVKEEVGEALGAFGRRQVQGANNLLRRADIPLYLGNRSQRVNTKPTYSPPTSSISQGSWNVPQAGPHRGLLVNNRQNARPMALGGDLQPINDNSLQGSFPSLQGSLNLGNRPQQRLQATSPAGRLNMTDMSDAPTNALPPRFYNRPMAQPMLSRPQEYRKLPLIRY